VEQLSGKPVVLGPGAAGARMGGRGSQQGGGCDCLMRTSAWGEDSVRVGIWQVLSGRDPAKVWIWHRDGAQCSPRGRDPGRKGMWLSYMELVSHPEGWGAQGAGIPAGL
jgi:hypothetical protein